MRAEQKYPAKEACTLPHGSRIAIVRSSYYEDLLRAMEQSAKGVLQGAGIAESALRTIAVPGSFEIPLACKKFIEESIALRHAQDDSHAVGIIALGVIIHGETFHASEIARACTDGLMRLQLCYGIPIAHGVLYCASREQAQARCTGKGSKGEEAARTLLRMMELLQ